MEAAQYVIQFWSRTRGRDKMNRLLQYSVGLHSSRLERSGETLLAQEWMQISKQVSLGRKRTPSSHPSLSLTHAPHRPLSCSPV